MSKIFKDIVYLTEFEKDKKKLLKRIRTLDEDLDNFINVQLKLFHKLGIDNNAVEHISDLGINEPKIYKVKKFACKALKGKGVQSGIRIIYSFFENADRIEFVEIYYKEDKENEDRVRIKKLYKK
jgi:mRNA-degrading endonuclease YafQ of YafQ-DinJ toxin-antitoxin module